MFLLWTLLAGLVTYKSGVWNRKAKRAEIAADVAMTDCARLGTAVTTARVLAEIDAATKATTYLTAQDRADKWEGRKKKTLHPKNRLCTYLAGKVDAAVATYLAYPYVPAVVDTVRGWMNV